MTLFAIGCIALAGGLLNGVSGFGSLILMTPLFVMLLDMETAICLGVFCGALLQIFSSVSYRAYVDHKILAIMLLGSVPGVLAGGSLLRHAPEVLLKAALGLFVILYVLWSVTRTSGGRTSTPRLSRFWAAMAGLCSGLFGGAFGIIGPPAVIYASRTGWEPKAIKGFLGQYFAVLFVFITISLLLRGMVPPQAWALSTLTIPVCLTGSWIGRRLSSRLKPQYYIHLVYFLLFCMGLSLCWPAVRSML